MAELVVGVSGMQCGHCTAAVERALAALPGVTAVRVDLEAGEAAIDGAPELDQVLGAILEAGFEPLLPG